MQPTLAVNAAQPGILYINGHFAGEVCPDVPLIRPVGSRGALYLDYRPLSNTHLPVTRKLVFSGGKPLPDSVEEAENLNVILWPGHIAEVEILPQAANLPQQAFHLNGRSFILDRKTMHLMLDGRRLTTLPEGAEIPELHVLPSGIILTGSCAGGKYLLSMDSGFQTQTGFLTATRLDIEADGQIRAVTSSSDFAGHAVLENWRLTPEGLMLISSESAWANGVPHLPQSPKETARAAVEAVLAGLDSEAERYLSPALRNQMPLRGIRDKCDLCVEMKYAPPGARPCVGLLRLEGERLGCVSPLYFQAVPSNEPQLPYRIEAFEYT